MKTIAELNNQSFISMLEAEGSTLAQLNTISPKLTSEVFDYYQYKIPFQELTILNLIKTSSRLYSKLRDRELVSGFIELQSYPLPESEPKKPFFYLELPQDYQIKIYNTSHQTPDKVLNKVARGFPLDTILCYITYGNVTKVIYYCTLLDWKLNNHLRGLSVSLSELRRIDKNTVPEFLYAKDIAEIRTSGNKILWCGVWDSWNSLNTYKLN